MPQDYQHHLKDINKALNIHCAELVSSTRLILPSLLLLFIVYVKCATG